MSFHLRVCAYLGILCHRPDSDFLPSLFFLLPITESPPCIESIVPERSAISHHMSIPSQILVLLLALLLVLLLELIPPFIRWGSLERR